MLIASMLPAGPPVHFMCDRLAAANSTTRVLSGNVCPFAVAVEVSVNRYGYDVFNLRSASMRSLRASFDGLKELVTRDGLSLLDVAEPLFLLAAEGEEEELPEPLFIRPRLQPTSSVDNVSRIRIELDRSDIWSPYCLYNRRSRRGCLSTSSSPQSPATMTTPRPTRELVPRCSPYEARGQRPGNES